MKKQNSEPSDLPKDLLDQITGGQSEDRSDSIITGVAELETAENYFDSIARTELASIGPKKPKDIPKQ